MRRLIFALVLLLAALPSAGQQQIVVRRRIKLAVSAHSVDLSWLASSSENVVGYKVYRGTAAGGPYVCLGQVNGLAYHDGAVSYGMAYYYVITAIDNSSLESSYSDESAAFIPLP